MECNYPLEGGVQVFPARAGDAAIGSTPTPQAETEPHFAESLIFNTDFKCGSLKSAEQVQETFQLAHLAYTLKRMLHLYH